MLGSLCQPHSRGGVTLREQPWWEGVSLGTVTPRSSQARCNEGQYVGEFGQHSSKPAEGA